MRTTRALLVAGAVVAALAGRARGDTPLFSNQDYQQHLARNLGAPLLGQDALRLRDLAVGSCLLKATGVNVPTFVCAAAGTDYQAPLTSPDASIVFPTASSIRLRDVTGLSVMGRSSSSAGVAQDITATADGQFLQRVAGSLAWASTLAGTSVTGTPNSLAYFNGSGVLNSLTLAPEFTLTTGTLSLTANGVANAKLATAPPGTIKGNPTGFTATVQDVAAGAANLVPVSTASGWGWSAVPAVATNGIVANWPIANARYYAIDGTFGSDSNVCYSDTTMVDAAIKACATIAGLVVKFPSLGAGRIAIIDIRRGTYTDSLGPLLSGVTGYASGFPLIRATGDLASAGATAFANDAADSVALGAVTATGMNSAGYTPKAGATTRTIPLTQFGGADPGFSGGAAGESTVPLPLGAHLRFSATTATAALQNVSRTIIQITGTDTVSVPLSNPLPAAPTTSDLAFIEMPGVNLPASTIVGFSGNAQLVGLNFTGNLNIRAGAGGPSLAFTHATSVVTSDATLTLISTYTTNAGGFSVGGSRTNSNCVATRAPLSMQESVVAGTLQVTQGSSLSVTGNTAVHDVLLSGSGNGPQVGGGFTFGGLFNGDYVRVLSNNGGVAFSIYGTKVQLNNIKLTDGQFAYAFDLRGKNDVMLVGDITTPISGVGVIGFGQTHSTGWRLDSAINTTLTFLNYQTGGTGLAYQVTGADGDFRLPVPSGVGFAPATYADLAKVGALIDAGSNRIVFGSSNADMAVAAPTTMAIAVGNSTGADIPAGSVVQIGGGEVNLARGDTEAHMAGPLAITITAVKNGLATYRGYAVTHLDNYRPILDGAINWPAPLFVSATTPGAVSSAARTPGQPTRRIGHAMDTAAVRFEPEQGTVFNQLFRNGSTDLAQQARVHVDGTSLVATNDAGNSWTNLAIGAIPEASITGLTSDLAGKQPAGNYITALTGGGTATGPGSVPLTLHLDGGATVLGLLPLPNQAAPTGTGFVHDTTGAWDGAARAVDVSGADITNQLKATSFPALTGAVTTPGASLATTLNLSASASITGALALTSLAQGGATTNQALVWNGSAWVPSTLSTAPTGAAGGALTGSYPNPSIANGVIVPANFSAFPANTLFGNPTGSSATPTTIPLGAGLAFSGGALNVTVAGGADALGTYWVSSATHAPANAFNWGALGNGVHQQTTSGSVATPTVFTSTPQALVFGVATGGGLDTDNHFLINPSTHAFTATGSASFQGAVTTIGAWNGVGIYTGGVVSAFGAGAGRIPFGSGTGGGITDSANLTFDGSAELIGSADVSGTSLALTRSGLQGIEKRGTGNLQIGTLVAGQSLGFYVGNGSYRLTIDGTTGNTIVAGNLVVNTVANNSLVKTDGAHTLTAATGADITGAVIWPNGVLEGAFGGLTSYVIGSGEVVFGSGTAGGATSSSHMAFVSNALTLDTIDSNNNSINLTRGGLQQINKGGSGALSIGTSTANPVTFYVNNGSAIGGWTSTGDLYSTHLASASTQCVQASSTGALSGTGAPCGTGGGGGISSIGVTAPIVSTGGSTPNISLSYGNGLSNVSGTLSDDLHTGVSGGQSVVGGTVSGNSLTLTSNTSHDGKIFLGNSGTIGVLDELGRAAFGQTTVDAAFHVALSNNSGTAPTPLGTTAWDSKWAVFGAQGSTGGALGISRSTGGQVYMSALAPSIAWQELYVGAHDFQFYSDGGTAGFFQLSDGNIGDAQLAAGGVVVASPGTGKFSVSPALVASMYYTTRLYTLLNGGELVQGGYALNPLGIGVEYPVNIAASHVTLSCTYTHTTVTSGIYVFRPARNGVDTSIGVSISPGTTTGTYTTSTTVSSPATSDTWGLDVTQVGTATNCDPSTSSCPDITCSILLTP